MNEDSESPTASESSQAEQVERDNARVKYQAAVSLVSSEGSNVWARYGHMLLINTIFVSVLGLTSNAPQPEKNWIWIGISSIGLGVCSLWWAVNDVGFRYFFYWVFAACELEERYLGPTLTVGRAFPIAGGGKVPVVVGGTTLQLPIREKDRFRVVGASKLIIVIFGVLYGILLFWSSIQLLR